MYVNMYTYTQRKWWTLDPIYVYVDDVSIHVQKRQAARICTLWFQQVVRRWLMQICHLQSLPSTGRNATTMMHKQYIYIRFWCWLTAWGSPTLRTLYLEPYTTTVNKNNNSPIRAGLVSLWKALAAAPGAAGNSDPKIKISSPQVMPVQHILSTFEISVFFQYIYLGFVPNGFTAGTKQPSYPCPRPQFDFQESRSLLSQKAVSLEFRATSTMSIAEVIKKQTNRDTCKNYIYMYVCICVDQLGRPCHILSFGLPGPYVDGFKKDREVIYI